MQVHIAKDKNELGKKAAQDGAKLIREAIKDRGEANVIVATGASQFEMLTHLVKEEGIAWNKVHGFHLDEYVGMELTHKASFRTYLWKRFVSLLPLPLAEFNYLNGEIDAQAECKRVGELISKRPIDVAFVGIGENAHMAFNDPPADFDTDEPYLVVNLDEACRNQQLGEGWFDSFDDVPKQAMSMSIKQVMKSKAIICSVPDERKSVAVQKSVEGEVTPDVPSSILQNHSNAGLYLDQNSASKLNK